MRNPKLSQALQKHSHTLDCLPANLMCCITSAKTDEAKMRLTEAALEVGREMAVREQKQLNKETWWDKLTDWW